MMALMENAFAKEVYDAIKELSIVTKASKIDYSLYRARIESSLKSTDIIEFDFPPKEFVSEGRYNHAGVPALYLASDPETCFFELRESLCMIAEINIIEEFKILDLTNPYESHDKHEDLLNTLTYSALTSAKQSDTGWYKPKYIFTRFIADCAKYSGFDAIKYPSTRKFDENYNIVILNDDLSLKKSSALAGLISYSKNRIDKIENCCG
ncbi:MAG: hypothetical protein ACI88H_000691 [Cocleimonas sp.]|jgi:hypothetical protein